MILLVEEVWVSLVSEGSSRHVAVVTCGLFALLLLVRFRFQGGKICVYVLSLIHI